MLRKIRVVLAAVMLLLLTFLFVDITGAAHQYLSWTAKVQFLPSLLSGNVVIVVALLLATLLFGRLYCSLICPLGILQDVVASIGKRARRNRYSKSKEKRWLRAAFLVLFIITFIFGIVSVYALLAPYSSFGRIAVNLFQPIYIGINNLLALLSEHFESYAFYGVDVWLRSLSSFVIALLTLGVIGFLAWRNGRTYCNTICPVGTILGYVARFSLFAPVIDKEKCKGCRLCERNCKAACIDIAAGGHIDRSRCVSCFNCIEVCAKQAVSYKMRLQLKKKDTLSAAGTAESRVADTQKRTFLSIIGLAVAGAVSAQEEKLVDGGLAIIEDKMPPRRETPLVPAGAGSLRHFQRHCTGCQLCVGVCPNNVLRPTTDILHLMQPEMSFERGFCRPSCNRCSQVCPAGAIRLIEVPDKSSVQIGHAVWVADRCVVNRDNVHCGNCSRHCPTGAITMVHTVADDKTSPLIPTVNEEKCIGCGACENVCPSRPLAAIYVEGHEEHKQI